MWEKYHIYINFPERLGIIYNQVNYILYFANFILSHEINTKYSLKKGSFPQNKTKNLTNCEWLGNFKHLNLLMFWSLKYG